MRIKWDDPADKCFGDIELGWCFGYAQDANDALEYFICASPVEHKKVKGHGHAINLVSGNFKEFNSNEKVRLLRAELVVKPWA